MQPLHVCCRLKRHLTDVQTTNVDMVSEVAASSGRESHHLHCIQSLSAQTARLQAENTELTGRVSSSIFCVIDSKKLSCHREASCTVLHVTDRVTTCLENLDMSGRLTAVSEMSVIYLKVK